MLQIASVFPSFGAVDEDGELVGIGDVVASIGQIAADCGFAFGRVVGAGFASFHEFCTPFPSDLISHTTGT